MHGQQNVKKKMQSNRNYKINNSGNIYMLWCLGVDLGELQSILHFLNKKGD